MIITSSHESFGKASRSAKKLWADPKCVSSAAERSDVQRPGEPALRSVGISALEEYCALPRSQANSLPQVGLYTFRFSRHKPATQAVAFAYRFGPSVGTCGPGGKI